MSRQEYVEPNSEKYLSLEDLPNEIWKDIKGYEGLYQVSNYGRVKSLDRYICPHHRYYSRILKLIKDKDGYMRVQLCKNSKGKLIFVHRIVGDTFLDNPQHKPIYNHLIPVTKDYCNNNVDNLEPATYSENNKYPYIIGTKKIKKGLVYE